MGVLVGKQAPDFTANAVMADGEIKADFNFAEHINGKYAVLFFYPLDFTFVCPSELIAFDHRIEEFKKLGVEVIGCSTDSHFTHKAWRSTAINHGGIGEVKYPLVADLSQTIARDYDVEVGGGVGEDGVYNRGNGIAYRGSFLIDKSGVVRHQVVNDLPLGRNIDEMLRMIDALQFFEENGEVCPAGWTKGDAGMNASPDGVAEYLSKNADDL